MFAATTSPSYSPTWAGVQMPLTSSIAHRRSPARRCWSTGFRWVRGSTAPVGRPIPWTRGRRPAATSSRSPRRSLPPSNCRTYSPPSRRAAAACIPSISSIPSRRRASPSALPSGAGSRGSTRSAPSTSTASPPRRRTICATSTPADPPPSTSRRRGTAFMLVASRVPHTPSSPARPGIAGTIGSEPVATTTCSAVWRTPSTSITPPPASPTAPRRPRGGPARAPPRLTRAQQRLRRNTSPVGAHAAHQLSLNDGDAQPARRQRRGAMLAGRPGAENDHVIVTARAHRYLRRLRGVLVGSLLPHECPPAQDPNRSHPAPSKAQHRLAAEGFLYLGDRIANLGLLAQLAALRWVQANIAALPPCCG